MPPPPVQSPRALGARLSLSSVLSCCSFLLAIVAVLLLLQAPQAVRLEELLALVLAWRSKAAARLRLAPGAVFADHVAKRLALSPPESLEAVRMAGVRISGARTLKPLNSCCHGATTAHQ